MQDQRVAGCYNHSTCPYWLWNITFVGWAHCTKWKKWGLNEAKMQSEALLSWIRQMFLWQSYSTLWANSKIGRMTVDRQLWHEKKISGPTGFLNYAHQHHPMSVFHPVHSDTTNKSVFYLNLLTFPQMWSLCEFNVSRIVAPGKMLMVNVYANHIYVHITFTLFAYQMTFASDSWRGWWYQSWGHFHQFFWPPKQILFIV